ncbi:uncharacterized protein LOC119362028 [Triticum dicoccoides]|uniref:uncharacterized protein LOC119362028 n=1 Tax=Triticum dicoccoides TaxID=85692 RepID=UPI00188E6E96|nr:uncharacterized protein LOC119362028 [Triticum dicoccoides]
MWPVSPLENITKNVACFFLSFERTWPVFGGARPFSPPHHHRQLLQRCVRAGDEMEMGMEMGTERLEALAKEYPGYNTELLAHHLDNENLTVKYIPEDIKVLFETPSGFVVFAIDCTWCHHVHTENVLR